MSQLPLKYNPGLADDDDLIRLFVVRQQCLDFILRTIDENTGPSNQHVLVVGPRGSGKTMLVRRVASELRTNSRYKVWFPITFAEESYGVSTPGEFWLEALFRLEGITHSDRWRKAYEEIKLETDDVRVRERALAQLLDFATETKARILLIVENLNMLLGDQLSDPDAWDIRHTLMNEPRMMLLGTAVSRFSKITNSGRPWFELLAVHTLEPLSPKECSILWEAITHKKLPLVQLRPIQILTGGNPRLVRILAEFAHKDSFRDLMNDLIQLIDEHTEYFKSQLDTLPANERKAFVALLDLWNPVTAREVALNARISVSTASAYLNRLAARGAVSLLESPSRKKLYQSAERLYNIYYLMRKCGHPSNRVRAAVKFMVQFYSAKQLVKSVASLAREACLLEPNHRADHYEAYKDIVGTCPEELRPEIIRATPNEFFDSPDAPRALKVYGQSERRNSAIDLVTRGHTLQHEKGAWTEAEDLYRRATLIDPEYGHAWAHLGQVLYAKAKKYDAAAESLETAVQLFPQDDWAWYHLGRVRLLMRQGEQAEKAFRRVTELKPSDAKGWEGLADVLHNLGRYEEAEQTCKRAIAELKGSETAQAWADLGELYHYHLSKYLEAEEAYSKSLAIQKFEDGVLQLHLGNLLADHLGRENEAKQYFGEAEIIIKKRLDKNPENSWAWGSLGLVLSRDKARHSEAVDSIRKAIEIDPTNMLSRPALRELLIRLGQFEDPENLKKAIEMKATLQKAIEIEGWKSNAWPLFLELRLLLGEDTPSISEQTDRFLQEQIHDPHMLNHLAWKFYESGREDILSAAEKLARGAVAGMKTEGWFAIHTLATILGRQGRWREALEIAPSFFDAAAEADTAIRDCIEFAIPAASAGYASGVLRILSESRGKAALEPLEVGLRKFLNESPLTAQEISEVANDVAERIRQKQAKNESRSAQEQT